LCCARTTLAPPAPHEKGLFQPPTRGFEKLSPERGHKQKGYIMKHLTFAMAFAAFLLETLLSSAEPIPEEDIQYETLTAGKTQCDVGILYKETPDGMEIQVAGVATGKGADFRKWEVTDIKLDASGETLKPSTVEKTWGGEASFMRLPAAFVFAAIGSQYERYGSECASGHTCPVTGASEDAHPGYKGSTARAIDKAGMAAGMGLLTAQAKGEIPVLKCSFLLDREQIKKFLSGELTAKFKLENKGSANTKRSEVSLAQPFSDFVKRHPGLEHKSGVQTAGTFVMVAGDATTKKNDEDKIPKMKDLTKKQPGVEHKGGVPQGGTLILVNTDATTQKTEEPKKEEKKEEKTAEKPEERVEP
jgi:hypothetical protein